MNLYSYLFVTVCLVAVKSSLPCLFVSHTFHRGVARILPSEPFSNHRCFVGLNLEWVFDLALREKKEKVGRGSHTCAKTRRGEVGEEESERRDERNKLGQEAIRKQGIEREFGRQ